MFETREDAKAQVFDYIEIYYNRARSHSTPVHLSAEQADSLVLASFAFRSCQRTSHPVRTQHRAYGQHVCRCSKVRQCAARGRGLARR